eukprot:5775238-Ditylum_brightwellii.AAC.1
MTFHSAPVQQQTAPFGQRYKYYNNLNYCWTHGFDVNDTHTSQSCSRPKYGHIWYAMRNNTMGGSMKGAHKIPYQEGGHF